MRDQSAPGIPLTARAPAARLEPDAISVAQDTLIGLADTGPTVSVSFALVLLVAASAYAGPTTLAITAIPMLIIANAYRRLNLWNANCGASFEWVGRAINPYLGFLTGWLMLAGTLFGTLTPVTAIGPSVLAVFNQPANGKWPNVIIATLVVLVMLGISIIGIRISARTQVGIGIIEYVILIVFAVWGLTWVLGHHAGTVHISAAWFSLHGVGGKGSLVSGFLITVFMFSGWDGTIYVNEEVKHRRVNPGRAAMIAVAVAGVLFILAQIGLQGVVSQKKLTTNSTSVLVYLGKLLSGSSIGGTAFAFALALSVIAAIGVGIMLSARIAYGIASHRALPGPLANISPRFSTPVVANRGRRRTPARSSLGVPVHDLGAERVRLCAEQHRHPVRHVLLRDRALRDRLLPAPGTEQLGGRDHHRRPADLRDRVPRLDRDQVDVRSAGGTELLAARVPRHRPDLDVHRQVRAAVPVLLDQARELAPRVLAQQRRPANSCSRLGTPNSAQAGREPELRQG
jgi:hypothetical protein